MRPPRLASTSCRYAHDCSHEVNKSQKQTRSRSVTVFRYEDVRFHCDRIIRRVALWLSSKCLAVDSEGQDASRPEIVMVFR